MPKSFNRAPEEDDVRELSIPATFRINPQSPIPALVETKYEEQSPHASFQEMPMATTTKYCSSTTIVISLPPHRREPQWSLVTSSKHRNYPIAGLCPTYSEEFSSARLDPQFSTNNNMVIVTGAASPNEIWIQQYCHILELMQEVEMSYDFCDSIKEIFR